MKLLHAGSILRQIEGEDAAFILSNAQSVIIDHTTTKKGNAVPLPFRACGWAG